MMVRWLVASEVRCCAENAAEIFLLLLTFFSFLFCVNFSPFFALTPHGPPEEASFPPPLAHSKTTRSRDEKIKINGTTRTTGVRKTFILYIVYIQRDACERECTRDEGRKRRARFKSYAFERALSFARAHNRL